MTDKDGYQLIWIEKGMFSEGYYECRNGIVYHCNWSLGDVVRRDEYGNYLVRRRVTE